MFHFRFLTHLFAGIQLILQCQTATMPAQNVGQMEFTSLASQEREGGGLAPPP